MSQINSVYFVFEFVFDDGLIIIHCRQQKSDTYYGLILLLRSANVQILNVCLKEPNLKHSLDDMIFDAILLKLNHKDLTILKI